ncbi:MAG: DUF4399 domain-containing protein [Porticoccaceae bacterium]
MKLARAMVATAALVFTPVLMAGETPAPEGAKAYIISPADGATVSSPVTVQFGLSGIGVAPAGIEKEKTGHHHLLIDVKELPDMNSPIPGDEHHRHFGGGQTEVSIDLPPGQHTLQLLLGDHHHIPHNPRCSPNR